MKLTREKLEEIEANVELCAGRDCNKTHLSEYVIDQIIDLIDQHEDHIIGENEKEPEPWTEEEGVTVIINNQLRAEQRQGKLKNEN